MKKILSQSEAEAIINAMAALNNVGGTLVAHLGLKSVREVGGRFVVIEDHATGEREEYDGQGLFSAAYNLY